MPACRRFGFERERTPAKCKRRSGTYLAVPAPVASVPNRRLRKSPRPRRISTPSPSSSLVKSWNPSIYLSVCLQETDFNELRRNSKYFVRAMMAGATSGIGEETARVLAMRGARLVLPARNLKAALEIKSRIAGELPESEIIVLPLDLSSLSSVRSFVSRFLDLHLPLNLLINNAGKFSHNFELSEDGIEMTFATNYLGHFLLTKLLIEKMVETAATTGIEGRIVNVSSGIHTWFSGDGLRYLDLVTRKKIVYDATRTYALSKLANVLHTIELAEKLEEMGANVTVNCVHPGIVRTRLTRDREGFLTDLAFAMASKLLKTIPQAAATTCYVAVHPAVAGVTGKYFVDCNEASPSEEVVSMKEAARFWSASEEMTMQNTSKEMDKAM